MHEPMKGEEMCGSCTDGFTHFRIAKLAVQKGKCSKYAIFKEVNKLTN